MKLLLSERARTPRVRACLICGCVCVCWRVLTVNCKIRNELIGQEVVERRTSSRAAGARVFSLALLQLLALHAFYSIYFSNIQCVIILI